jgi:hypothetical protein
MSPLDKLWYAGDRRFGALGMSSSFDEYSPVDEQPLMSVNSIQEAAPQRWSLATLLIKSTSFRNSLADPQIVPDH